MKELRDALALCAQAMQLVHALRNLVNYGHFLLGEAMAPHIELEDVCSDSA
jgi:hypothetical protein